MKPEARFLNHLRKNPWADAIRLAYADWLEEYSDFRAEYLRLTCKLATLAPHHKRRQTVLHRLYELGDQVDAEWEFTVCRPYAVVLESYDLDWKIQAILKLREVTRLSDEEAFLLSGGWASGGGPKRPLPKLITQGLSAEQAEQVARQFPYWHATVRIIPERKEPSPGRVR
jgi:uncharacterized protein (TIGR02996 family)